VAIAIDSTVVAAVVWANMILLDPNAIDLVLLFVDANIPVVKLNPPRANAPLVSVVVAVAAVLIFEFNVQPPPTPSKVTAPGNATAELIVCPVVVELNVVVPVYVGL